MTTAYLYDPIYRLHFQHDHIEGPERLDAINRALDVARMRERLIELKPQPIDLQRLTRVHHADYVAQVKRVAERGGGGLMGRGDETYVAARSYDAALLAAGAVVTGMEAVLRGDITNAFACVRPPGHHAFADHGEGFCLFNNVAVAAQTARSEWGIDRVLIVDFDVHHGNGTNAIFYADPSVLFFSTHQWGIYPGTGHWNEIGAGAGVGYSVNVPVLAGWGDAALIDIFDQLLEPLARRFKPQLILCSAGYDAHWGDTLGGLLMTDWGFFELTRKLVALANDLCQGKLVLTLEGGYGLDGLAYGVVASLSALLGDRVFDDSIGPPPRTPRTIEAGYLDQLRALHGLPPYTVA